jgi:hypothetical protein
VVLSYFGFWQSEPEPESACSSVPKPGAPAAVVWDWFDQQVGLNTYNDQWLAVYDPYYYQAASQLGSPDAYDSCLSDLLRYPGASEPATYLPLSLKPKRFDYLAMPDIDFWVKSQGQQLLFVYGSNDPWGAEPVELGFGTRTRTATSCRAATTVRTSRSCPRRSPQRRRRRSAGGPGCPLSRRRPLSRRLRASTASPVLTPTR